MPTLSVDAAVVSPGRQRARVCVRLATAGKAIAGAQNDLVWDGSCATLSAGSCFVRARRKQLSAALSPGSKFWMRAFVLAFENVDPIADGDLYCCDFATSLGGRCCDVRLESALASTPGGDIVEVRTIDGEICPARREEVPCGGL